VASATEMKVTFAFTVRTEDYKIEVPTLVFNKIAEVIEVSGKLNLVKQLKSSSSFSDSLNTTMNSDLIQL
jgi:hypothetical protein